MPLCTLVPDVDTVTVKLGSGAPGIWAGSSCGMPIGRISHHDHPTFGIPRQGVTSSVTSEPTAKQAQTVSGAKHFVHRICDLSFLKLASPEKTGRESNKRNLTTPSPERPWQPIAMLVIHTAALANARKRLAASPDTGRARRRAARRTKSHTGL